MRPFLKVRYKTHNMKTDFVCVFGQPPVRESWWACEMGNEIKLQCMCMWQPIFLQTYCASDTVADGGGVRA